MCITAPRKGENVARSGRASTLRTLINAGGDVNYVSEHEVQ